MKTSYIFVFLSNLCWGSTDPWRLGKAWKTSRDWGQGMDNTKRINNFARARPSTARLSLTCRLLFLFTHSAISVLGVVSPFEQDLTLSYFCTVMCFSECESSCFHIVSFSRVPSSSVLWVPAHMLLPKPGVAGMLPHGRSPLLCPWQLVTIHVGVFLPEPDSLTPL